jgi:hypothetical protein
MGLGSTRTPLQGPNKNQNTLLTYLYSAKTFMFCSSKKQHPGYNRTTTENRLNRIQQTAGPNTNGLGCCNRESYKTAVYNTRTRTWLDSDLQLASQSRARTVSSNQAPKPYRLSKITNAPTNDMNQSSSKP